MSFLAKKWVVLNEDKGKSVLQKILKDRGIDDLDALQAFHDPYLFSDMQKAVERIIKAIERKKRIMIFGDYDVDGITSTAIVFRILKALGAEVSCRLPHRVEDGYGLSNKFIEEFKEKNVDLLITVDCGISCKNQIALAADYGIDVIITDHHRIPEEIPGQAYAIIHPKLKNSGYPYSELTGAGVALKLAQALSEKFDLQKFLPDLTTLAALGTVADLGPLLGENRLIVRRGLENMPKTRMQGLRALLRQAGLKEEINSGDIGFRIAPRINAAGRIGNPYLPLSLLLEDELNNKLLAIGTELENLNQQRKAMTEEIMREAEDHYLKEPGNFIIIAANRNWHIGVLGLVAGKLAEKYARPAVIMQEMEGKIVGSARSPEYFDISEALANASKWLESFGGHVQAAGFSLDKKNLPALEESLKKYAAKKLKDQDLKPILAIDCELYPDEINFELTAKLAQLEPFGIANKEPLFIMRDLETAFVEAIGRDHDHLKFSFSFKQKNIDGIAFRMGGYLDEIRKHRRLDIVCKLAENTWNNQKRLQLQVIDLRPSE